MKDVPISNTLYWAIVGFMAIIFVATVIFNSYLFVLDNKLMQQVNLSQVNYKKTTLIIDYGNGQTKIFQGDVPTIGLSLYDILLSSAEAGDLEVKFLKDSEENVQLACIDRFFNDGKDYWELQIPSLNWSKKLNEGNIDLKRIYITGGTTAYLVYK